MAYPKSFSFSSLALIAFLLIATTSLSNCQLPTALPGGGTLTGIPLPLGVTVLGVVSCGVTPPGPRPLVNVTLSCDGGITPLVPSVTADVNGVFSIRIINLPIVNLTRCAVIVRTPVAGCGPLRPGQILRAPIVLVSQLLPPVFGLVRVFLALAFSVVRITV